MVLQFFHSQLGSFHGQATKNNLNHSIHKDRNLRNKKNILMQRASPILRSGWAWLVTSDENIWHLLYECGSSCTLNASLIFWCDLPIKMPSYIAVVRKQFLTLLFLSLFQVVLQDSFQGDVITMVSSIYQ